MSRVHDMGGRYGDGAVDPNDEETFVKDWHAKALALNLACGGLGQWNIDASRHARERLSPKDYSRFSYYEKWMAGLTDLLVEKGVVSVTEVKEGRAKGPSELAARILNAEAVAPGLAKGGPANRQVEKKATFKPGDRVRTRSIARNDLVDGGHTRLPGYAAGKVGQIVMCHDAHVFPDTNAHGLGENPEFLYAVAFPAESLWGKAEAAGDEVILDVWQSYLGPV